MLKPTDYGLKLKQTKPVPKPVVLPQAGKFGVGSIGNPSPYHQPNVGLSNLTNTGYGNGPGFGNIASKSLAYAPPKQTVSSSLLYGGKVPFGIRAPSSANPSLYGAALGPAGSAQPMSFADAQAAQQGRPTSQTFNGGAGYSGDYSGGSTSSLANVFGDGGGDGSGAGGGGGAGNDQQSYLNSLFAQNGIDGFNLDGKSNEQLSSILTAIQGQINKPQDQGSLVDLLRKSREEAGVGGLQNTLKTIQDQINQRNQSYQLGSNKISDQPIPQDLLIGQRQALQRQQEAELSGLTDQQRLAQEQLGFGNEYAGQLYGAYQGDQQYAQEQPNRLIDLASKAFGLQQMQGDLANMPLDRQLKQVQLQQAIKEGQAAGYKFEQVGNTLLRIGPNGDVTPVYTGSEDGQDGQVKLSAGQQTDFADMNTLLQQLDQLGQMTLSGVGPITGRLSGIADATGYSNSQDQTTRAAIGNIRGTINKLRAGTSLTDSELKQLNSYVPSQNDTPMLIMNKAKALSDYIKIKQQNLLSAAGGGYNGGGGNTVGWF